MINKARHLAQAKHPNVQPAASYLGDIRFLDA